MQYDVINCNFEQRYVTFVLNRICCQRKRWRHHSSICFHPNIHNISTTITQHLLTMKQGGLDTLAALCGGASKAFTDGATNATGQAPSNQAAASSSSGPAPIPSGPPSIAPLTVPIASGQQVGTSEIVQSAPQTAPPQTAPMDPSVQQWQNIASAASYGSVPNPAATAAFASIIQAATQNHAVFPQHIAPTVDPNVYMQQIAYYQYLAAAQAQQMAAQGQTQAPNPAPVAQPAFAVDPNAATPFALAGRPAAAQFHVTSGEFLLHIHHRRISYRQSTVAFSALSLPNF